MPKSARAIHTEFVNGLARKLILEAVRYSRPKIPSKTLQDAIEVVHKGRGYYLMQLTYYWSYYVHYGRGEVKGNPFLVYFRNPADDPRLSGGYPRTARGARRLSKGEWDYWVGQNKLARRRGNVEPMVVVKAVSPTSKYKAGGLHPSLFWDDDHGMLGFRVRREQIVREELRKFVLGRLPSRDFSK